MRAWRKDPSSVAASWDAYFSNMEKGMSPQDAFTPPPSLAGSTAGYAPGPGAVTGSSHGKAHPRLPSSSIHQLIRAYQTRGHECADLDPLEIVVRTRPEDMQLEKYGITDADLDAPIDIRTEALRGFASAELGNQMTLRELIARLEEVYCGTLAIEFMHIGQRDQCNWLRERIETLAATPVSKEDKSTILRRLNHAEQFEKFLARKYVGAKRFGVEGAESFVAGLQALTDMGKDMGLENVVIGMAHRGRLNVLANVMRKPYTNIFNEFQGSVSMTHDESDFSFSGDVKYHQGQSVDRVFPDGKVLHCSLLANPSHLEAVNPVVLGKARASQYYGGDETTRNGTAAVLIHGDAAFAGQGVVPECFELAMLEDYKTGGTLHLVINNQIGFTTVPSEGRSSRHPTDVAKAVSCPVLHVNGDDPEAVVRACQLAIEYRQTWQHDVVVDVVCYRRHGHNEGDEPSFTQPEMYAKIRSMETTLEKYAKRLVEEGSHTAEEVAAIEQEVADVLETSFSESKSATAPPPSWLGGKWEKIFSPSRQSKIQPTCVPGDVLKSIGRTVGSYPEGFKIHPKVGKVYKERLAAVENGSGIDWGTAEALAFGSLLREGVHVRVSGQDVERGTFSHRHAVLHSQEAPYERFVPLHNLEGAKETFIATNSPLSEFAVLGFELGYSMEHPQSLVIWEAQFGDFANGAQVIFDQFMSSQETKWLRQSGIVVNLPHAYEGQGPEHSSARLERYLQMCNDNPNVMPDLAHNTRMQVQQTNWQVLNMTTSANYFHMLRRQVHRNFRKPAIVMSPKSLLKYGPASSNIEDFATGSKFNRFYGETDPVVNEKATSSPDSIRRVIFCSGKVYYDLVNRRAENEIDDVFIARIEQICPFPFDAITFAASQFKNAEIVWAQEEPENMGAWTYVVPRIHTAIKANNPGDPRRHEIRYVGRPPSAATATGFGARHKAELEQFLGEAFN